MLVQTSLIRLDLFVVVVIAEKMGNEVQVLKLVANKNEKQVSDPEPNETCRQKTCFNNMQITDVHK